MSTNRPPAPEGERGRTVLDHRIEAATGLSVDQLWEHRDRGLLDQAYTRLADAHCALAQAQAAVMFHRTLLHRMTSGEAPIDNALLGRIDRTVEQLKDAAGARDDRAQWLRGLLEPLETAECRQGPAPTAELKASDVAALLAIAQGAKLHEHLLTQRLSVVTASSTRIPYSRLQRLEEAGLVQRDTSHPVHAGQPVTLTDTARAALSGSRRMSPPAVPAHRTGAWPPSPAADARGATGTARRH